MQNLEELIKRAESRTGRRIAVYRKADASYQVLIVCSPEHEDQINLSFAEAVARLKELAMPSSVTVTVAIQPAKAFANLDMYPTLAEPVMKAFRDELDKLEQP